jgi:hypothetical protein
MQSRRLEDRIKELSRKLLEADGGAVQFQQIAVELQNAIAEHTRRARERLRSASVHT